MKQKKNQTYSYMDFEEVKKKKSKNLLKKYLRRFSAILVSDQNGITPNFFVY